MKTLGILGAMHEEVASIVHAMKRVRSRTIARREFVSGDLFGQRVVIAQSRWGKVAAAVSATHIIQTFNCDALIFTGVAGSLDERVRVGDLVVARRLYQHDLDASPLFAPMEIPLLGRTHLDTDRSLRAMLLKGARAFVRSDAATALDARSRVELGVTKPRVFEGDIATGDQFVSSVKVARGIKTRVPRALCVEMEGASVGQVCYEHNVPMAVIRTISDNADHGSPVDFPRFLQAVAGVYAVGVMRRALASAER
jgi:adenosylhomocysteine nucleosidase